MVNNRNMISFLLFIVGSLFFSCNVAADHVGRDLQTQSGSYNSCPPNAPLDSDVKCGTVDLRCPYGKESCCGKSHESIVCNCNAGSPFSCWVAQSCLFSSRCNGNGNGSTPQRDEEPATHSTCPLETPYKDNRKCGDTELLCEYGTETCCGVNHASVICRCTKGAGFKCQFTDACVHPPCEQTSSPTKKPTRAPVPRTTTTTTLRYNTCPLVSPLGSTGKCGTKDLRCSYGTESCCGNTYEAIICNCEPGLAFSCWVNDICKNSPCGGN